MNFASNRSRRTAIMTVFWFALACSSSLTGCSNDDGGSHADVFDGFQVEDLEFLASDALDGRDNFSPGSLSAQAYIIDQLRGVTVGFDSTKTGDDAFKQPFDEGTNILAVIPGSELPDEFVIVGAHYDHFGGCGGVCNGATDNAAGVVAVLAAAREIADNPLPPRRSVMFALWDAEEDGLLGSAYYIQNPAVPRAKTIGYVNFDIQGANLLPSLRRISFAVGAETGGARMLALLDEVLAGVDLDTRAISAIFGQGRSDYFHFVNARIPTVFFSDSTGPCYHTNDDDVSIVDLGKLEKQSEIGTRMVEALAQTTEPPIYERTAVSYHDAVVVREVLNKALVDLGMFAEEDRAFITQLSGQLDTVVAEGAENFTPADVTLLAGGVLRVIDILTDQPCDGFLE